MAEYTSFEDAARAIEAHVERKTVRAVSRGLVPTVAVECADLVRVATGANRAALATSLDVPRFVTNPRDRQWPAPTRREFAGPVSAMTIDDTAYIAQAQKYSAAREALDGAIQAGIAAGARRWKRDGEKAAT